MEYLLGLFSQLLPLPSNPVLVRNALKPHNIFVQIQKQLNINSIPLLLLPYIAKYIKTGSQVNHYKTQEEDNQTKDKTQDN